MEETRSAAVWGKSVTGGSLWWRVPVQQELKVSKLNYVWQEQTVWAGPTRPTITATGGLQSLRRETAKRGNTHIYIHTVSGQMGVHSLTLTHTHIHTHQRACVGTLTHTGVHTLQGHGGKFISALLCPLHTERLPTLSDPSLFSYDNAVSRRYRLY